MWESYIDWRIMRMVEEGVKLGTDQVCEVVKPIMVRVSLEREDNLAIGLEVGAWLAEGSVDFVVGQDPARFGRPTTARRGRVYDELTTTADRPSGHLGGRRCGGCQSRWGDEEADPHPVLFLLLH